MSQANIDHDIHQGKIKVSQNEKRKNLYAFSHDKNMANFEAFLQNIKLSTSLLFLKNGHHSMLRLDKSQYTTRPYHDDIPSIRHGIDSQLLHAMENPSQRGIPLPKSFGNIFHHSLFCWRCDNIISEEIGLIPEGFSNLQMCWEWFFYLAEMSV